MENSKINEPLIFSERPFRKRSRPQQKNVSDKKLNYLVPRMMPRFLLLITCCVLQSHAFLSNQHPFGIPKRSHNFLYTSDFATNQFSGSQKPSTTTNNVSLSTVASPVARGASLRKESPHTSKEPSGYQKYNLTLVLIDHYDSFTYNLYDMLAQLCENPPIVLAKDAYEDWSNITETYGPNIDGVILSPGPGTPTNQTDIGSLSPSILEQNPDLPILGVCLGHQIMGHFYGATVDLCGPVHGQVRTIEQVDLKKEENDNATDPLWLNIPPQIDVTRYHSLAVTLPENTQKIPLHPTAYTVEDDQSNRVLMAMSHTENPHYGVQFHPESIGSQQGLQLLKNFCDVCRDSQLKRQEDYDLNLDSDSQETSARFSTISGHATTKDFDRASGRIEANALENTDDSSSQSSAQIFVHKVPNAKVSPLDVFEEFLGEETYSVWLDTSVGVQSATDVQSATHSSILGAGNAPIEYYGKEYPEAQQGLFRYEQDGKNKTRISGDDILTYLQGQHAKSTDSVTVVSFGEDDYTTTNFADDGSALPFDFRGGHVGYLGYEVRHDSQRFLEEQEQGIHSHSAPFSFKSSDVTSSSSSPKDLEGGPVPSAAFLFLDKSWVYDHSKEEWYLIAVVQDGSNTADLGESIRWMKSAADKMSQMGHPQAIKASRKEHDNINDRDNVPRESVRFKPNRSRDTYNQNFADCQEQIRLGESYEICLTNQLEADVNVPRGSQALGLYKILRNRNPAPFSAFLNWNTNSRKRQGRHSASLALCCSSPERFVSVKRKQLVSGVNGSRTTATKLEVEAKPIKGTCARVLPKVQGAGLTELERAEDARRALELKESVKNRAENLMIVDLLRNDLSRVCEVGSVHVSNLMDIESYATVHQMVSTIRGTLDPCQANAVDILKATFPGGSMTGAPKIRTIEIIDQLEEGVSRGPYSGCLGYISMNGSMDMNIVIRTAVLKPNLQKHKPHDDPWKVSIGAGGAITALSESSDEYQEMRLKASAVIRAVEDWIALANADEGLMRQELSSFLRENA